MRIKYFGGNKENITGRLAVIRFTDNEWDLYDFIANYENTHGDKTRKFNGRVFVDECDENGVTINEAYIDVAGYDDFINFKANFEEAKKEFNSLKKQVTETESETATDPETAEADETTDPEIAETEETTDDQFHRFTKTLIKSLIKAIGLEETKKIPFIISNNMVFFNYNGVQYKYYPSQCKIFHLIGKKYTRINWKKFADDNSPNDQKQALGRSPPLLLI